MKLKKHLYFFFFIVIFSCSKKEPDPVKSSAKSILSFTFNSLTPNVKASIDSIQRTITAVLPIGTNLSNLSPSIVVSNKATINPASGITQDFTKPVNYSVTAEDGTTQTYSVNISIAKSTAKNIKSFVFNNFKPAISATIDSVKNVISATLPFGTDLTKQLPTIIFSEKSSITPNPSTSQDFTKPVTYTVTAEDGSIKIYTANIVENLELCKDGSFNLKVNNEILKISRAEIEPYYSSKSKQFVMGYFFTNDNNKFRYFEIIINDIEDFKTGIYSVKNNRYQKMAENERYNLTGSMIVEKISSNTFSAKFILDATYASDKLIIEACIQNFPIITK